MQVIEGRLFSEGLHVLGQAPSPSQTEQYLAAYFGEDLSEAAVSEVAGLPDGQSLEEARAQLERTYSHSVSGLTPLSWDLADGSQHNPICWYF